MSFKTWLNEMQPSPVLAHFFVLKNGPTHWGVYSLDPFGEKKFLFSKMCSKDALVADLRQWAETHNYQGFSIEARSVDDNSLVFSKSVGFGQ